MTVVEHWYIYYTVPETEAAAVAGRVQTMLARLREGGAYGRLLRRPDGAGGQVTLMEVYEPVADAQAFAATLDGALRESGLAPDLIERRRVERFEDV